MAYRHPSPPQLLAPHIALWMLRLLTSPQGMHKFVRKGDFARDDLAYALGLNDWIDPEDRPFSPVAVRAALYQRLVQAQRECARSPLPALLQTNVQRLAALVGLDAVDARILAFAVCLHTDPLLDDAADLLESLTSTQVVQTVAMLLDLPDAPVRRALGSQGLLARSGLVVVDRSGSSRLKGKLELLSHTFADQLVSGDADPIHLLRGKIQPAAPGHLGLSDYGHIQTTLDIVRPWLRHAQGTGRRGVNLYVHGAPGTGKTELARALAHDMGCELFEVASEDEDGDPISGTNRLRAFRAAQSFLAQRKALLLFDEVEDVFSDSPLERRASAQSHKAWLNRMLEDNPLPTLWLSNAVQGVDAAFIRRFDMVFELPVPPRSQRERIVQAHCGDLLDAPRLARVAAAEHLAPAVVARASAVAQAILPEVGRTASAHAFEHLVSHTLQAQGHRALPRHDANRLPEVYDPAFLNADADLAEVAQGLAAARGTGGARLCLYGPPGTGKTAFGRWLAGQLDMPLQVERASDLLSMYVGQAEKNIARAFRQAEDDGALLLIDEVDSFLQDRRGAQRSWEVTQVNEMLTQMEGFAGIFIASTNLMDGLDPAALRRFDLKVKFDCLGRDAAWALLQRHCAQLGLPSPGPAEQARLTHLKQLTPGDFAAVVRQQRFRPLSAPDALVAALESECALKQEARNILGFV
ncbi:AAA family ATPase [Diaphorobacter sp.]|uniref:AAA family ATPase n=1 Tax=Diaphorobacter sp. TaxID=1934310 RepID=UPI003D10B801